MICDIFSSSLISSLVLIAAAVFFFGLGEFSNSLVSSNNVNYGFFEVCSGGRCSRRNTSLVLTLIGFLLLLHSAIFSLLTIIFKDRMPRNDLFKVILAVLIYDVFAIIFMITGWNELKNENNNHGWSFYMLIIFFEIYDQFFDDQF